LKYYKNTPCSEFSEEWTLIRIDPNVKQNNISITKFDILRNGKWDTGWETLNRTFDSNYVEITKEEAFIEIL